MDNHIGETVNDSMPNKKEKNKKIIQPIFNHKARIFVYVMVIYAFINWFVFYVYGSIDSVLLAFKEFHIDETGVTSQVFLPINRIFDNFITFFKGFAGGDGNEFLIYFFRGALYQLGSVGIAYPVSLIFSYLIYKKLFCHNFLKIMLFMPSIISCMFISIMFKFSVEALLPTWFPGMTQTPLADRHWTNFILIAYTVFFAMPGQLVMNTSMMSRIPPDLIDYGKLEGVSMRKEFTMVVLPCIYPLITVQCLGVFVGFFGNAGPLYAIYGDSAEQYTWTYGYYMTTLLIGRNASEAFYGFTAASNLLIGLVSVPIVYATKWLLERFDPGAEY